MNRRAETHTLGFALFGFAWPVLAIAGRILLWIVTAVLIVALALADAYRWVAARARMR